LSAGHLQKRAHVAEAAYPLKEYHLRAEATVQNNYGRGFPSNK